MEHTQQEMLRITMDWLFGNMCNYTDKDNPIVVKLQSPPGL